jgi:quinol monooxygenase YgiN
MMSIGVIVDLEFKSGGAAPLIEMMKERLPFTRSYEGCEMVELYADHENPEHLVLLERWASRAAYDKYRKWAMAQEDTQGVVRALKREMTTLYLDETGA